MATSPQAQKSLDRQGQGRQTEDSRPLARDHEVAVCSQPDLGCKGFCGNDLRRIPVPRMVPRFKNYRIFSSFQKIPRQISGLAPEELNRSVRTLCSSPTGLTRVANATTRVARRPKFVASGAAGSAWTGRFATPLTAVVVDGEEVERRLGFGLGEISKSLTNFRCSVGGKSSGSIGQPPQESGWPASIFS